MTGRRWYEGEVALALAVSVACVAVGALIGFLPGARSGVWAPPVRTFAFVAAAALALGELLPEAIAAGGLLTLLVFAAAWALPSLIERRTGPAEGVDCGHHARTPGRLGLEAGYVGLLVHKVGDGLALGAALAPGFAGSGWSLAAAMAAHSVPVAALVAIAYRDRDGTGAAVLRVAGLAVAMAAGATVVGALSAGPPEAWAPWITAAVAGTLMHIVAHGWRAQPPESWAGRGLEVAAVVAGVLVVALPWAAHAGPDHTFRAEMAHHGLDIALDTAPALLIGLLVAAVIHSFGSRLPVRWLTRGRPVGQAARGALVGIPLPVCACGVLPMAHSLRARGATPAFVLAFLVATPELGVETFALTVRFLGWPFAVVRLVSAVAIAFVAGLTVSAVVRRMARATPAHDAAHAHDGHAHDATCAHAGHVHTLAAQGTPGARTPRASQVLASFDELFQHVGPWAFIGILAAAYTAAALPAAAFDGALGGGLDMLLVTAIAIPSYVCASSATPLAAVLLAKGISPGAVLVGLLLGPATNVATVGWLRSSYGTRATVWAFIALVGTTWALALTVNTWLPQAPALPADAAAHGHGWAAYASATALLLLLVRAIGRDGLRTWLASLGESALVRARTP
jgi:uncharacterized protein